MSDQEDDEPEEAEGAVQRKPPCEKDVEYPLYALREILAKRNGISASSDA